MTTTTQAPPRWDPVDHLGPCTAEVGCANDAVLIVLDRLACRDRIGRMEFRAGADGARMQRIGDQTFPVMAVCEHHAHDELDRLIGDAGELRRRALDATGGTR
jgi:hypothetical protein